MAGSGRVVSYGELDEEANRLSRVFYDMGLRQGDHVAFCLENHARFLPVCWGARYAGLIYTAISSRSTTDEMAYVLDNNGAQAFITSTYKSAAAADLLERTPKLRLRLMMDSAAESRTGAAESRTGAIKGRTRIADGRTRIADGYESYEVALAAASPEPLGDRIAGTDMLYSSGTTGRPKGVVPQHRKAPLEEAASTVSAMLVALFGVTPESVYLSPAPLYHAAPLRFSMAVQMIGGTVVVMERFDAARFLSCVETHSVTHTQVVPTMFVRMLKLPSAVRHRSDISSLTHVVHAAAPCPEPVKQQMIDWWGPIIHEYYAGTEANGFCYCNTEQWLAHPGTVGAPINCEVHIVDDETGREVEARSQGTVYFSGAGSFEYHGDPAKTEASRLPNGWSTLGDVGRVDEDGFLYLTDRKDFMIISGGVNVYPQEAENLLTVHPEVLDAAVIGVPDDEFGEQVKAVVEPVEMPQDEAAAAALQQRLIDYCRSSLADVKCPKTVDFRAELPRHPTGKLYKRLLRDEYWPQFVGEDRASLLAH